jgi:competence protein ComEC
MQSWMIGTAAGVFCVGWMPTLPPPALTLLLLAISLLVWRRAGSYSAVFLGLACGLAYGHWWGEQLLAQRLPTALEGPIFSIRGRVMEVPQQRRFARSRVRQRFAFTVTANGCPEGMPSCAPLNGRILLSYYGKEAIRAGQRWRFIVRLKKPWGLANPGSFNYQSWLAQNSFAATGYVRDAEAVLLAAAPWWWRPHQQWRQAISQRLDSGLSQHPQVGVLRALSIGDRSGISTQQWQLFQRYGLNHLVVISGLHVGMVAAIGFLVGGLFSRRWAHITAAALALLYASLAGFALPTVRALVMLASVQCFALLHRRLQATRCLSLALLVIALMDPLATHNAGFWLSFGAVGLIFYLRSNWPHLGKFKFLLLMQTSLSLAMGLLGSFWFGGSGWVSPLANLVAIPVLSFWVAPLCLLAAVFSPLSTSFGVLAWELAAIPVAALSSIDEAILATGMPLWLNFRPPLEAVLAMALGLLLLSAHRAVPLRYLALLCLCLPLFPAREEIGQRDLQVTVLDVGQGLSVLVRSSEAVVLYDTGAGDPAGPNMASSVVLPYLQQQGLDYLDLLVISHNDRDHASGIYTLHGQLDVARTWYGEQAFSNIDKQTPCRAGDRLELGALKLLVLHSGADSDGLSGNDSSCVILIEYRQFSLLLPGDISARVERELSREQAQNLKATVLLAPHHGSASSSSASFLRAVDPELVVFSSGYRNRFGHPHSRVLQRYDKLGITGLDTAQQGAVLLQIEDGKLVQSEGWRRRHRFYWY